MLKPITITDSTDGGTQPSLSADNLSPLQCDHTIFDNATLATAFKVDYMYGNLYHAETLSRVRKQDKVGFYKVEHQTLNLESP